MKEVYQSLPLEDNEAEHRFEMKVGEHIAFIDYKKTAHLVALIHTEVPQALEGQGAATAIIEKALAYAKDHHLLVMPVCPFVVAYLKKHPEWKGVVDRRYQNIWEG